MIGGINSRLFASPTDHSTAGPELRIDFGATGLSAFHISGSIAFTGPEPSLRSSCSTSAVSTSLLRRTEAYRQHCVSLATYRMPVPTRKSRKAFATERYRGAISPPLPYTTQWHYDHRRGIRRDKAIKQQLLMARE
jgi:hypothetical protein